MTKQGNIDPCLRTLGSLGRYQLLQVLVSNLAYIAGSYQLMNNIFIGRHFSSHQCSSPDNVTLTSQQSDDITWNSSDVEYGQCEIIVSANNSSVQTYPCLFGHSYDIDRHLSFRTEFDLVCDRKMLGGLVQSLLIMGQGFGAVTASFFSDRYGRKPVMIASHLALVVLGIATGFVSTYSGLASLKFFIGAFQQGVITSTSTISIEWFPAYRRANKSLIGTLVWGVSMMSLSLVAFLMRHQTWRSLQIALSAISGPIVLFQLWYMDESLRWLMANNRKKEAHVLLQRAARANKKDFTTVLNSLSTFASTDQESFQLTEEQTNEAKTTKSSVAMSDNEAANEREEKKEEKKDDESQKMSILDLFRNRRLLINAVIIWIAWFACAFSFFTLYMMSHSLHGDRYLNVFLTSLMEFVPGFLFYLLVDRVGRKWMTIASYAVAGIGLITSGVCRNFADMAAVRTMSVVMAMVGMIGASGMFTAVFLYTAELFPTNIRNQILGLSSFIGRLGGMLAPFMDDLAEIAVWAPGAMIGSLCFLVVALVHFLPETKGRELPSTVSDVKGWYPDNPHHITTTTTTITTASKAHGQ